MDFVKSLRPDTGDKALVWWGRGATLGFMVVAALWAPQITRFTTLWQYLQSILSYTTPSVVVIFLGGIFWARGTKRGAEFTLATGLCVGVAAWLAVEVFSVVELQFLYASAGLFILNAVFFVVVSLLTEAPEREAIDELLWRRGRLHESLEGGVEERWWNDHRVLAIALGAVTAAIVVWWW
ncbi:MAG: sodium:solute symporter family transporter [Verrucomicrobiota bacterium]